MPAPRVKGDWKLGSEKGTAEVAVDADAIAIGDALRVEWLDVDGVEIGDHRLTVRVAGGDALELSMLGGAFQNVANAMLDAFDAAVSKGLMLDDGAPVAKPFDVRLNGKDEARVQVHENGLAVLRVKEPFALGFGRVEAIVREEWVVRAGTLTLTHAGPRFDELQRTLEQALAASRAALSQKVTALLADAGPMKARALAAQLRDGIAVAKSALEATWPGAFAKLTERGALPDRAPRLQALLARATGEPWAGMKLPADARENDAGPALFFVVPVEKGELAFEVASEADHATYRFAGEGCTPERLAQAMVEARFRREPVYAPADEVARGEWRMALRRQWALPMLRSWFKGREAHGGAPNAD
ncbi:MAG TPA: hypothetical protein VMV18_12140 [bacterium]|nr:hypothetical protein [bacterium]